MKIDIFRCMPSSSVVFRRSAFFGALFAAVFYIQGCSYYSGPQSDHFDGSRFYNEEPENSFSDHLKWIWEMETVEWPEWIDDPLQPPPVKHVGMGDLSVTYINHATLLIQMDGLNILTDPIWSERAGPFSWLGVKRIRAPGVRMDELPDIDVVLISHDHYDHLDLPTLEQLIERHSPLVLTGLGVRKSLDSFPDLDVAELDWWQEHRHPSGLRFVFVPSRHGSGRGMFDGNKTLWGGFIIRGAGGDVLFLGDTGYGGFVDDIRKRYSGFRLAILPIGSYEKRWFMKSQHMNPDDAVQVHRQLNVSRSVGSHYGTFAEHPEQSVTAHETDLASALEKYNISPETFRILQFGEGIRVP